MLSKLLTFGLVAGVVAVLIAGFAALVALAFQVLWNYAVVDTFSMPSLTFMKAWALWLFICFVGTAFRAVLTRGAK